MKKNTVIEVVKTIKTPITERIDSLFQKEIEEMCADIEYSFEKLSEVIDAKDSTNTDFYSAVMLWTFQNTLISAISLIRQGYLIEPMMLLRNSVEGFSVAYSIQKDENLLKKFQENPKKFPSTNQVTFISKDFPLIGKLYGLLSNFTHASEFHSVPSIAKQPLKIGPGISTEENKYFKIEIIMLKQIIYILSSIIEYSYAKNSIPKRFWTIDEDGGSLTLKKFNLDEFDETLREIHLDFEKV